MEYPLSSETSLLTNLLIFSSLQRVTPSDLQPFDYYDVISGILFTVRGGGIKIKFWRVYFFYFIFFRIIEWLRFEGAYSRHPLGGSTILLKQDNLEPVPQDDV